MSVGPLPEQCSIGVHKTGFPVKYAKMLTSNRILEKIREWTKVKASARSSPSRYTFKIEAALSIASSECVTVKDIVI